MGNFSTDQIIGMLMDSYRPCLPLEAPLLFRFFLTVLHLMSSMRTSFWHYLGPIFPIVVCRTVTRPIYYPARHTYSPLDCVTLLVSWPGQTLCNLFPHWFLWRCTELHWLFLLFLVGYYYWYLQDPLVPLDGVDATRYDAFFDTLAIHTVSWLSNLLHSGQA